MNRNRREFLSAVGRGALVASVGPALAADLFFRQLRADEDDAPHLRQARPARRAHAGNGTGKLLPLLVERLRNGADLQTLLRPRPWPTPAPSAARTTSPSTP